MFSKSLEQIRLENEERRLEKRVANSDRFSGSLTEYSSLKGQEYEIMDTGRPQKYVYIHTILQELGLLQTLFDQGCVAFIRYVPEWNEVDGPTHSGYGIPVKRK